MSIEIGSLVVRGSFGQTGKEGLSGEEIADLIADLRADILQEVREMMAEADRRSRER